MRVIGMRSPDLCGESFRFGVCPHVGGMAADVSAIQNALHTLYTLICLMRSMTVRSCCFIFLSGFELKGVFLILCRHIAHIAHAIIPPGR